MHVLPSPSMMSRASRPLSLTVPPEIFRFVTKVRMSFSEALVLRGISGRSRTRLGAGDIYVEIDFGHKCRGRGQGALVPENQSGRRCGDRCQQWRRSRSISYVAFKVRFAPLEVAWGTGGHINVDATLSTTLSDWLHREAH